jgi:alpha-mannosidase
MPPTLDALSQAIQAKIDALRAPLTIREWQFKIGAAARAASPKYDDSRWQTIALMHTWSSLDGEAWFRANVTLPDAVAGIPLGGSRLELELMLPIGAVVYVNGKERYREPSWADTRAVPLLLEDSLDPSVPLALAVRCNAGDGFGLFIFANLRASAVEQVVFALDTVRGQMTFTRFLAQKAGRLAAWEQAAEALNLDALAANDWAAWQASVASSQAKLTLFAEEAKNYTAHLVAHSHIDMNWLWPMAETVDVCKRDFAAMDGLMARYPEFRFSQSQAATYRVIEQEQPELFERMRARIASGQWDVTANTWVEGDLNTASGEALVRQLLHARRYLAAEFGVAPLICWEPDTFGHPATMPQILAKSGIRYYYFCRAGKRHPLFWWEGIDGSRVLGMQDLRGYGGAVMPSDIVGSVLDCAQPYATQRGLFVYGAGDHGGSGTARDIEAARAITATQFLPRAEPSATVAFYEHALADVANNPSPFPVIRGELNTVFEGCYTSHADIKRLNREWENGLVTAEAVATLAKLLAGAGYPLAELAEAWRTGCFHQFHDILCGCAISVTYREAHERLGEVLATAQKATGEALRVLAAALDAGTGAGPAIAVFNPLGWARDDVVRVPLSQLRGAAPAWLVDDVGNRLPAQVSGDAVVFVARDVPAFGARVFRPAVVPAAGAGSVQADAGERMLDNGLLRLRVHAASGALDHLVDAATGRDLGGPWAGWGPEAKSNAGMLNRLQILWEQPHGMSAWNIGDITRVDNLITGAVVNVVESGPVRAAIEVKRQFLKSSLTQRIVLWQGLKRVDFETEVDWHERGSAHTDAPMLRATFAPYLGQTDATFEIAFAGLVRPADGREVPALRWADVSERGGDGLSLLNNCKYGHQAHGNTLGLTLVRASYEPDVNPDEGLHRFTYSLYPHAADWQEAATVNQAAGLNQPLLAVVLPGTQPGHPAKGLRPGQPGLTCDAPNVIISAVKLAEDQPASGSAVIVRVYEAHGKPTEARLRPAWAVARAEETDLIEQRVADLFVTAGAVVLKLAPHEIKTVRLICD